MHYDGVYTYYPSVLVSTLTHRYCLVRWSHNIFDCGHFTTQLYTVCFTTIYCFFIIIILLLYIALGSKDPEG